MATVKSSALMQLTEMTECCICLKTFTDPRTLPCIHTFCFQCLKDMVDKSDRKPGDEIQCSMCRKEFTLPNDGVQGIQKNFFMAGLIEVRSALNQTKTTVIPCDVCKANTSVCQSKTSKATLRCMDCQENLCEDCYNMHKAFRMLRNHKVLKIDSDIGKKEAEKTLSVINCDIHRSKLLDYYCAECKKVVCVSCFVESHRTHDCKDVNTVEGKFRKMIRSSADKISTLAGELLAKKEKSKGKEDFLTRIAERENEILQRSNVLKEMIDEHAKSLLSSLDDMKNRRLKEMQAREDELDRHLIIVESFKRYCNKLISKGSASDICRGKDELLLRAEVIEEDHETYIMRPRVSWDVAFSTTDISNFLKSTNGNMVGSLKGNANFVILASYGSRVFY